MKAKFKKKRKMQNENKPVVSLTFMAYQKTNPDNNNRDLSWKEERGGCK